MILFQQGVLYDFLESLTARGVAFVEELPEDDLLGRSDDDVVIEAVRIATCDTLRIETSEVIDFDIEEIEYRDRHPIHGGVVPVRRHYVWAEYPWEGNDDLFWFVPSTRVLLQLEAEVSPGKLRVGHVLPGSVQEERAPEQAKAPLDQTIGRICNMVDNANRDAVTHNEELERQLRQVVAGRRDRILKRLDLKGSLGFKVSQVADAPRPVPLTRKVLGVERRRSAPPVGQRTYQDEHELGLADYEDVISILAGMLRAFERTPSVAIGRDEELLRDNLLVQLNGTFEGAASGETFVRSGKTDILVRVEDRHVFVGECKWYDGPRSISLALDQLLHYLPWRDEKAALLIFIDRANASAAIDSTEKAIRDHPSFKRDGAAAQDPTSRRDFVLGNPDDQDREIRLAVRFAIIRD